MTTERDFAHAEHDRRIANALLFGSIAAVQGDRASVQVEDGWTTDLLRMFQVYAGKRVRSWSAPTVGEQVAILCPSGEPGAGVILRGLSCAALPDPSARVNLLVSMQADDGALDTYDLDAHVRTLAVPVGGKLVVDAGANTSATIADGVITLAQGAVQLVIQGGAATLTGATSIALGQGGQAVARVGDRVDLNTGLIVSGSGVVRAA